jgi:hypothetical protein
MMKTPLLDMDREVLNIDLFVYCVMLPQGESSLRRGQGGFSIAPLTPSAPPLLGFHVSGLYRCLGERKAH